MGAVIFLRLERGVSGEELGELGYKVTVLPKKGRTPKAKASRARKERKRLAKKKRGYTPAQLLQRALAKRLYRVRQKERLGVEVMRARWREKRARTKARRKARDTGGEQLPTPANLGADSPRASEPVSP